MFYIGLPIFLWICAELQGVSGQYNYSEVLEKSILFYEAQRSGALPADNRIPWRGDSSLDDGSDQGEDLAGGWHDAGDYVKFGYPMASAVTILAWGILEFRSAYESTGQLDNVLDSIKWPLDYFIKCHVQDNVFLYGQVADAYVDHAYWGRPENMTMARPSFSISETSPGSELAAETASAMAAASMAFRPTDEAYADLLLSHAVTLYQFAYDFRGFYTDAIPNANEFYPSNNYADDLYAGAVWMYYATGQMQYLNDAYELFPWYEGWALDWSGKETIGNLLLYILEGDTDALNLVETYLTNWMPGGTIPHTPLGLAFRSDWGSLRYAANSAFYALVASKHGVLSAQAEDFARTQIHYMLGDTGRSYVVGFGVNPPVRPHHAAASCDWPPAVCDWDDLEKPDPNPHVLNGALVGGPDQNDQYTDDRESYVFNEVTCDYNAGFQGAIAGLISLGLKDNK